MKWKTTFDLNQHKSETQSILSNNSEIFLIYSRLVPESISPQDFWERYFYRLKIQKEEEEKRIALLKGTAPAVTQLTWDEFEEEKSQPVEIQETTPLPEVKESDFIHQEALTTVPKSDPLTTEDSPYDTTLPPVNEEKTEKGEDWLDW